MKHVRIMAISLAVTVAGVLSPLCGAQTATQAPASPYPSRPLPPTDISAGSYPAKSLSPVEPSTAFSFSTEGLAGGKPVEYRTREQMSAEDRALADKSKAAIGEATTFVGIDFDRGNWSYQQLVCAALPAHLFLLYKADNGSGDMTLFSAAIPRAGNGQVRVIPIRRRGFAPFSPAPVNGLAIAAFNRIRADEPANQKPNWLPTALCYAALTGPRPQISPASGKTADFAIEFTPTIQIEKYGGSTVRFVDVAAPQQPMQWALTFGPAGQLVSVDHSAATVYPVKTLP